MFIGYIFKLRKSNLKFLADDYGMMRHKNLYRWKDFVFRLTRTEGTVNIIVLIVKSMCFFYWNWGNSNYFYVQRTIL